VGKRYREKEERWVGQKCGAEVRERGECGGGGSRYIAVMKGREMDRV
jgi:hypothetical protein